jgi:hypothetical protein
MQITEQKFKILYKDCLHDTICVVSNGLALTVQA